MNFPVKKTSFDLHVFFQSLPQWKDIEGIVQKFDNEGYKAWLVGGCVRDALCGVKPEDIDLATDAKPNVTERLFTHTTSIGKDFGTVIVHQSGRSYEITSFRRDGLYKDGRHPESIDFGSPQTDAQRRDFTCNALFFDVIHNQLIDFVEGALDIAKKQIRSVGIPKERFSEDALRLLRAIRFSAQLNWDLEENTLQAIKKQRSQITLVSVERVREELFKIILSDHPQRGLKLLESTKLFQAFLGEDFSTLSLPSQIVFYGSLKARLATLTYDWPSLLSENFFKKIQLSRKDIKYILPLSSKVKSDIKNTSLSSLRRLVIDECFEDVCSLLKALKKEDVLRFLDQIQKTYPKLPDPFFSGHDLQEMGFSSDKYLGDVLKSLRDAQLNNQIETKEAAAEFLKAKIKLKDI